MSSASDILGMSDEEFLKAGMPPEVTDADREAALAASPVVQEKEPEASVTGGVVVEQQEQQQQTEPQQTEDENKDPVDPEKTSSEGEQQVQGEVVDETKKTEEAPADQGGVAADKSGKDADDKSSGADKDKPKDEAANPDPKAAAPEKQEEQPKTINYEDAGKLLLAPLKANGKEIEIRSPEEARRLMQMGANYTKKLQDLQPSKNLLRMLEDNGLTDVSRLSFLIDLDKKNPEAIKKLVKDSGIDPLTINPDEESAYRPSNYQPSEESNRFSTALEDVRSLEGGQETIQIIHKNWDDRSKDMLWDNPDLLSAIHEQRGNGIYDLITTELERQKVLGNFQTTPFLEAYAKVGDQLAASGGFQGQQSEQANNTSQNQGDNAAIVQPKTEPEVVAVRAEAPKASVANGDKASAAAPSKAAPSAAKQLVNPLAMSDEDFLKSMRQRL